MITYEKALMYQTPSCLLLDPFYRMEELLFFSPITRRSGRCFEKPRVGQIRRNDSATPHLLSQRTLEKKRRKEKRRRRRFN